MQAICMRVTVTLDDDVYKLAKLCARGKGITLSAAINELVRKGLGVSRSEQPPSRLIQGSNGFLVFGSRGRVITSEMVKKYQEDELD